MDRKEILAVVLILLASIGTVVGIFSIEKYRRSKFYTLELIARAPEHGNWHPRVIYLPYGQEVKILIRNVETVTHGFAIPDFSIAVPEIKPGGAKIVKFIPTKKGKFPFFCTVWCSQRHLEMQGEIVVE